MGLLAVSLLLFFGSTREITYQLSPNSDAFAGGFVAGIVEGKTIDEQVDQGHWLARLSIQESGPQYVTFHQAREIAIFESLDIENENTSPSYAF